MMMMSSAVNKQQQPALNPLGALKAPKEAKKPANEPTSPKLDLVDAQADKFELTASPRDAVADAPVAKGGDTLTLTTPTTTAVAPPLLVLNLM